MANTVKIPIDDRSWTEIATGAAAGLITIEAYPNVLVREYDSGENPPDILGHILTSNNHDFFSFNIETGQSIYVRSATGSGKVTLTEA